MLRHNFPVQTSISLEDFLGFETYWDDQDPDAVPRDVMHRVVSTQQELFEHSVPKIGGCRDVEGNIWIFHHVQGFMIFMGIGERKKHQKSIEIPSIHGHGGCHGEFGPGEILWLPARSPNVSLLLAWRWVQQVIYPINLEMDDL